MTAARATDPAVAAPDPRWRVRHLPVPLAASAVVLVAVALVGWLTAGGAAAAGAAAGVALVAAGYLGSTFLVAWADAQASALVLPFGLAAYVTKIVIVGVVMMAVAQTGWAGLIPMAWGIAAGVVAWTSAHIWWLARNPPYRVPTPPPGG
ncbi:MAG TPA: hypothetical protein VES42_10435 [Pilimelia sp.]|nr:hypothetical protein [Pilimelia sp.]